MDTRHILLYDCICSLAYGQSIRTWLDAAGQGAGQTVILPARREHFQGTERWHSTIHVDLYESQQVCQEYDTTDWLTKSPGCPCLNFLFFFLILLKDLWGETTSNHFKTVSWDFRFRVGQQHTVTFVRVTCYKLLSFYTHYRCNIIVVLLTFHLEWKVFFFLIFKKTMTVAWDMQQYVVIMRHVLPLVQGIIKIKSHPHTHMQQQQQQQLFCSSVAT